VSTRKTPLHEVHKSHGARMVEFAGWEMPLQYQGALPEHQAVRTAAGVFDVSHMGEIEVEGPGAEAFLQKLTCNDVGSLSIGQAQYSALLYPTGTFVDDIVLYRFSETHYMLCVNAANRQKDLDWILGHLEGDTTVSDRSDAYVQLAVQGHNSPQLLAELAGQDLSGLRYYWFLRGTVGGHEAIISRTGYTGEPGYELYISPRAAVAVWESLFETGGRHGLQPAGLAARNTLRLEMTYALYGNDISDRTTPLEASLAWIVKLDKGDFIGREALLSQRQTEVSRKLVGFEMTGRGVPRDHYPVFVSGRQTGEVTSGSYSPTLQRGIGLTYLPSDKGAPGQDLEIEIRGRKVQAEIVETPFYQKIRKDR